jgi:hypothetical protein
VAGFDGKEAQRKHSERNIVLAPRSTELLKSSNQVAFLKTEKIQEYPGREAYSQVLLSTIECPSALLGKMQVSKVLDQC